MSPEVTVLIPVRNGEAFLRPTLQSVARLRGDFEVLVVDDGSSDGTGAILDSADARFRILRQRPGGLVAALNLGLETARGRYIARLDADDVVHPDRLVAQLAIAKTGVDVVGSGVRSFPTQQIQRGLKRYTDWQNSLMSHAEIAANRFVESPLIHPSVLFDREHVLAVDGYRDAGWPEDYDLWLRLLERGARFGKSSRTLTFWRDHPNRVTRTADYCAAEAVTACRAHFLVRGPLIERAYWMMGAGPDAKRLVKALTEEGARLAGWFDLNPRRIGQVLHGAPVCRFDRHVVGDSVVLVALGGDGQRSRARAQLNAAGLTEAADYWCVA